MMVEMNEAAFKKAYDAFAGTKKKFPTKEKLFFAIRTYLEHANKHPEEKVKSSVTYTVGGESPEFVQGIKDGSIYSTQNPINMDIINRVGPKTTHDGRDHPTKT